MSATVGIGDLIRYRHNKNQVGLVLDIVEERHDPIYVLWCGDSRGGAIKWFVRRDWIQVKCEGKWRNAL